MNNREDIKQEINAFLKELSDKYVSIIQNDWENILDVINCRGTKEEIDKLSDIKLQERMTEKALFVKAADRLDNLCTIDIFPEEKQIKKAKHTREVIIPMLMKEEAYKIIDPIKLGISMSQKANKLKGVVSGRKSLKKYAKDYLTLFDDDDF